MNAISIRQLEVFVGIATLGTVRACAANIHLSQPAASMALAELEKQLDCPLFERTPGRMQLTSRGKQLLPHAREILERLREMQSQQNERELRGEIRIGASNTVGNYLIGDLVGPFVRQHPRVSLHVSVDNTANIINQLLEHSCDIACVEGPVNHPQLEAWIWRDDALVVCAAPDHPLATTTTLKKQDFAGMSWIMRERGSASRALTEQALNVLPGGHVLMELGQVEAIKQAVIAGLGLACLPQAATQDAVANQRLRILDTPFLDLKRRLSLVLHKERYRSQVLSAFAQHLHSPEPGSSGTEN
ncbi:LysR family transcriptional regulator [Alcaligenes faecalis]|uniref:LysR family transcriptional regulator n=1 Tax=Alcaligenes faecalis TaxID=511 RepID=A0AB33CUS7_ALCFA|nr:LysR family transcriptional regulator [Alcaligenes faecalis]ASR88971.1 LysR family transcriptional regulator [Alcaligenes faecalis]